MTNISSSARISDFMILYYINQYLWYTKSILIGTPLEQKPEPLCYRTIKPYFNLFSDYSTPLALEDNTISFFIIIYYTRNIDDTWYSIYPIYIYIAIQIPNNSCNIYT